MGVGGGNGMGVGGGNGIREQGAKEEEMKREEGPGQEYRGVSRTKGELTGKVMEDNRGGEKMAIKWKGQGEGKGQERGEGKGERKGLGKGGRNREWFETSIDEHLSFYG